MKKNIKQSSQDLFNSFELSPQQLSSLHQLEKDCVGSKSKIKPNYKWLALVASVVLLIFVSTRLLPGNSGNLNSLEAIAAEVSYNHLKFKPLEVAHHELNQVTAYFERLDFNPLASSRVTGLSNKLIGGRYCSIQGNIAAQLRMSDEQGRISTLFESRYNAQDFKQLPVLEKGQNPVTLHVDGQMVELWVEKGLVMALVQHGPQ